MKYCESILSFKMGNVSLLLEFLVYGAAVVYEEA